MEAPPTGYRSRYRKPDPARGPKRFPTERDIAILKRLDLRRFSAANWLHHFVGGSYTRFDHRMSQLFDGGYVGRMDEYLHPDTVHSRHLVYFLTDKGRRALVDDGIQPMHGSTRLYLHECLTSFVYDSIEIGCLELDLTYRGWNVLQHDERIPARHSERPFKIKLSNSYLNLDGSPFVISRGEQSLCIPGVEIDRNTEPLRSYVLREKWTDKFRALKEFIRNRVYQSHFGFPNCLIPIYTTNREHMHNMIALAYDTIGRSPALLFQFTEDLPKARVFPKPNGSMLTEPYLRIDQPPFHLAEGLLNPAPPPKPQGGVVYGENCDGWEYYIGHAPNRVFYEGRFNTEAEARAALARQLKLKGLM